MKYRCLALVGAMVLSGTGCSSVPPVPAMVPPPVAGTVMTPVVAAPIDASVIRGDTASDYARTDSVVAAARSATLVIEGVVEGWADGRATVESDGDGYEAFEYTAVLTVRLTGVHRKSPHRVGDLVAVEVRRGGEVRVKGRVPDGTSPVLATIDDLGRAAPAGSPVILLARRAPTAGALSEATGGLTVRNDGLGVPPGRPLLRPTVQGLIFRDADGSFVSGVADGEREWGWLPAGIPWTEGFGFLSAQLKELD